MSEVKVNKISPRSGTTITLGDSGDTFTVPSGVTLDASSGGLAGTLTTAAQPNITSVGTLTSFTSTGIDDNATSTAITIDSSERVGINTSSPAVTLDTSSTGDTVARFMSSGSTGVVQVGNDTSSVGTSSRIHFIHNSVDGARIDSVSTEDFSVAANRTANLQFKLRVNGNVNEIMRLQGSNVGIGTSSPSQKLHVNGNIQIEQDDIFYFDNTASKSYINRSNTGLNIRTSNGLPLKFLTINGGEAVRIDSSGNVGIGTSSPTNALTVNGDINSNKLQLASNAGSHTRLLLITDTGNAGPNRNFIEFHNNSNSTAGRIEHNGSTTVSYITSSDYRLKENVDYTFDATTRLKQLKPARFNFIEEPNKTVDGFLAHEVSDIVPEAISGEKDEVQVWKEGEELPEGVSVGDNKLDENGNTIMQIQGIDQAKLVPLLVKTIQELEARITTLENA